MSGGSERGRRRDQKQGTQLVRPADQFRGPRSGRSPGALSRATRREHHREGPPGAVRAGAPTARSRSPRTANRSAAVEPARSASERRAAAKSLPPQGGALVQGKSPQAGPRGRGPLPRPLPFPFPHTRTHARTGRSCPPLIRSAFRQVAWAQVRTCRQYPRCARPQSPQPLRWASRPPAGRRQLVAGLSPPASYF